MSRTARLTLAVGVGSATMSLPRPTIRPIAQLPIDQPPMASLEERLLRKFIELYESEDRDGYRPGGTDEDGEGLPSSTESALAILLATLGDIVRVGDTIYRREGLTIAVHRDVPSLEVPAEDGDRTNSAGRATNEGRPRPKANLAPKH